MFQQTFQLALYSGPDSGIKPVFQNWHDCWGEEQPGPSRWPIRRPDNSARGGLAHDLCATAPIGLSVDCDLETVAGIAPPVREKTYKIRGQTGRIGPAHGAIQNARWNRRHFGMLVHRMSHAS